MSKSPFNWIGNKDLIMPQLLQIFPQDNIYFIDYFCGGCDVITNVNAQHKIAIDVNKYLIEILQEFQTHSLEKIVNFIEQRIDEFQLSKENEEGFLKYREAYNTNSAYHTPLDLYTLTRFSFHFTMRFNRDLKFNAGFGRGYSNFSARQRKSIGVFHEKIQHVQLYNCSFDEIELETCDPSLYFLYFDPPYLITNNVYNNGVEKVWQRWTEEDEKRLLQYISKANELGFKFALSNVIQHRGNTNTLLAEWIDLNKFNVYDITNKGYSHCTHTVKQGEEATREIVVTNY